MRVEGGSWEAESVGREKKERKQKGVEGICSNFIVVINISYGRHRNGFVDKSDHYFI